jgi:hypothetical protein
MLDLLLYESATLILTDFSVLRTNKCAVGEVTDDQRQHAKQVTSFLMEQFNKITMRKPIVKYKGELPRASLFNFRSDKRRFFLVSIDFFYRYFSFLWFS